MYILQLDSFVCLFSFFSPLYSSLDPLAFLVCLFVWVFWYIFTLQNTCILCAELVQTAMANLLDLSMITNSLLWHAYHRLCYLYRFSPCIPDWPWARLTSHAQWFSCIRLINAGIIVMFQLVWQCKFELAKNKNVVFRLMSHISTFQESHITNS